MEIRGHTLLQTTYVHKGYIFFNTILPGTNWHRGHTHFPKHERHRPPVRLVTVLHFQQERNEFDSILFQQSSTYLVIGKFTVLQIVVLESPNAGVRVVKGILANTVRKAMLRNQSDKVKVKEIVLFSLKGN